MASAVLHSHRPKKRQQASGLKKLLGKTRRHLEGIQGIIDVSAWIDQEHMEQTNCDK